MRKLTYIPKFILKYGILGFINKCYYLLIDDFYEKYFNVDTKGEIFQEELGINDPESIEYSAVHYKHLFNVLKKAMFALIVENEL